MMGLVDTAPKSIIVRITPAVHKALKVAAAEHATTIQKLMNDAAQRIVN